MVTGGLAAIAIAATGGWAAGAIPAAPAIGIAAGAGVAVGVALGVSAMSPSLQAFGPAICRARSGRDEVALTFDDGPDPDSTVALCEALEAVGARATFFLLADRVARRPDLAQRIARGGHEIALHGPTHDASLTFADPAASAERLREAASALAAHSGSPIRWFRPPFGATSPRLVEAVRRSGLTTVWCSVRPFDAGGVIAEDIIRVYIGEARSGDIVLLHEGAGPALRVLPRALAKLAARGMRLVTISELLADPEAPPSPPPPLPPTPLPPTPPPPSLPPEAP